MLASSQDEIIIKSSVQSFGSLFAFEGYRGTELKGVSRNGSCSWQILYMNKGCKLYVCTIDCMFKAAILYDIFCIQTKGLKSRTNFNYTKDEIHAILQLQSLMAIKYRVKA
jgi:hypothetical protein